MKLKSPQAIDVVHSSGIAHVFMTRGATGNRLCVNTVPELLAQLHKAIQKKGCRAVVLRQRGGDFCVGMDIKDAQSAHATATEFTDALSLLHNAPLLTVAYVEGAAHGAGLGLAAACDVVIAGPQATFALPDTGDGLSPALIMPTLLKRLPVAKAKSLAISQRTLSAAQAMAFGLVDDVGVEDTLYAQLQALMRSAPESVTAVKSYLNDLLECPPDVHGEMAVQAFTKAVARHHKGL